MEANSATESHILIVDDYPDMAELLAIWLENRGHSTTTAHTRSEALEKFNSSFDAIYLDRQLNSARGEDVLLDLRKDGVTVPIAFFSSENPDDQFVSHPVDDYVHKPAEEGEVHESISVLMQMGELDRLEREYVRTRRKLTVLERYKTNLDDRRIGELRERMRELQDQLGNDAENLRIGVTGPSASD